MLNVPCVEKLGSELSFVQPWMRENAYRDGKISSEPTHTLVSVFHRSVENPSALACVHVNGAFVTDPSQLLDEWAHHFQSLAESRVETNLSLQELAEQSTSLLSATFQKEETFLDTPFTADEVECAVNRMKRKKSAGPDDLTAEHLRHGGRSIIKWLLFTNQ